LKIFSLFSDAPLVRLSFGLNVERERIVEGSDVYMDCLVQAKPKPYKVGTAKRFILSFIFYMLYLMFEISFRLSGT
jgi:hypothetical protein